MGARAIPTPFPAFGVEMSPFDDRRVSIATAQYFGIVGNGRLHAMAATEDGGFATLGAFETAEGLYDSCWSESHEAQLAAASADGSVKLFDLNTSDGFPVGHWHEHTAEAASVDWNLVAKDTLLSASWDSTVKLWSPAAPQASLRTFAGHTGAVYAARWSPAQAGTFASASGDDTIKLWDVGAPECVLTIPVGGTEVLALDFDRYASHLVVCGCVDRAVRLFDLRRPGAPVLALHGHEYPVRRLRCSPHRQGVFASVSYDMTGCLWDLNREAEGAEPLAQRWSQHTEFVTGVDFSLFTEGLVATCSWDCTTVVWNCSAGPPPAVGKSAIWTD